MLKNIIYTLCLFITFIALPIKAEEIAFLLPDKADFTAMSKPNISQVIEIIDPLRIKISDGRIIQLSSLHMPDLTPYDAGAISLKAREVLEKELLNKQIRIYQTKTPDKGRQNRLGFVLAHVERKHDDLWIQGMLLQNGLALVMPSKNNTDMARQMIKNENIAASENLGYWHQDTPQAFTPENAADYMHQWGIVEGTIRAAAMRQNMTYLNFGMDWKTDFTIGIPSDVRRQMLKEDINPQNMQGVRVRVHGWIEKYNGAYIELFAPEWIELLPEQSQNSMVSEDNN